MSIIFILIPVSIVIAACFLAAFIWAVKSGQYEDTCTPSMRLLVEETGTPSGSRNHNKLTSRNSISSQSLLTSAPAAKLSNQNPSQQS